MRKRKERIERSETLIPNPKQVETQSNEGGDGEEVAEEGKGFFACYLLCSLCPRFKGQTYIGFTVNPCRRIRQHNGELRSGAWRTKSKRPWEMILCIYGFPTNVTALQFEWAWQHPTESLAVRKAAASLKSLSGIAGKIKIAYTMLTLPPWESLKLTVNFFSTKYMKEAVGCKALPKQMKVQYCPMEELPCYTGCEQSFDDIVEEDNEDEDAENGTNQRHSEEPTYTSANNLSDFHRSNANTLDDLLKQKKNDDVSRPDDPSSQSLEEKLLALIGKSQPTQACSRGEDHRQPFRSLDSPVMSPLRSTNLSNLVPTVEDHRRPFHSVDSPIMSPFQSTNLAKSVPTVDDYGEPFHLVDSPVMSPFQNTNFINSPPTVEDHGQPFHLVDSPVMSPCRSANLVNCVPTAEDKDPNPLIEKKLDVTYTSQGEDHSQPFHLVDSPIMSSFRSTNLVNHRDPFAPIRGNQPEDSYASRGEDHRQPFHLLDSPVMSTLQNTNTINSVERVEDKGPHGFTERRVNEFRGETNQNISSLTAVRKHQLSYASDLHSPEFNAGSTSCAEKDSGPVKMSFSQSSGFAKIVEDEGYSGVVQESGDLEAISPQQVPETLAFADSKQPLPTESHLAPPQVEVIDISTPSSIDMFRGFRKKKKRNNWISQDVIDLTKSPNFIQL